MSNILPDGSVIPSNFTQGQLPSAVHQVHKNTVMHVGMVTEIIYPDSPNSISKTFHEYTVAVTNMDRQNGLNVSLFRNCKMSDRFASPNNSEVITLVPGQQDGKGGFKLGSVVILECIGGNSDAGMAIIVGGVFSSSITSYTEADGQVYEFMFNGLRQKIDKNGAWTLSFSSYIDPNGKPLNNAAAGTSLSIDKDGKFTLQDNEGQKLSLDRVNKVATWTNGNDSITIDKANKKIEMSSSGEMSQASQKAMSMDSKDAVNMSSQADTNIKSNANMSLQSSGNMSQQSSGNWQITTSGNAQVQAGGSVMLQAGGSAQINGTVTKVGAGSVPAAGVGISMVMGIGNSGLPVISSILTGSATVLIGT